MTRTFKCNNFFLSDSTTRPSDLPLYVIVESGNSRSVSLKSCFKWPRPFWGDLGRNENRPRPLPLTPMCRYTMVVLWGIVVPHIAHAQTQTFYGIRLNIIVHAQTTKRFTA